MSKVVTFFDDNLWERWGISFVASLKSYHEENLIIDRGLSLRTLEFLKVIGFEVIKVKNDIEEIEILSSIGRFAYWAPNTYFQSSLEGLFAKKGTLWAKGMPILPGNSLASLGLSGPDELYDQIKTVKNNDFTFLVTDCSLIEIAKEIEGKELIFAVFLARNEHEIIEEDWNYYADFQLNNQKVIRIPMNVAPSEISEFEFKTRFKKIYDVWLSFYRGNAFSPYRIFKK